MLTIAITGNFGMGKTTVLKMFRRLGAQTVDSDAIVHEILDSPAVIKQIVRLLGNTIVKKKSGMTAINKIKLAEVIFNDHQKRKTIEDIIHPRVFKKINAIKSHTKPEVAHLIFFEVPLLFEGGYDVHFDKSVVVHTRRATAIKRLMKKGIPHDQIIKRLKAQIAISKKKKRADYLIDNNGNIEETKRQVEKIYSTLSLCESH